MGTNRISSIYALVKAKPFSCSKHVLGSSIAKYYKPSSIISTVYRIVNTGVAKILKLRSYVVTRGGVQYDSP